MGTTYLFVKKFKKIQKIVKIVAFWGNSGNSVGDGGGDLNSNHCCMGRGKKSGTSGNGFFGFLVAQCTEVRFVSFFSGGFITAIVVNPAERKLAKCISVQCGGSHH